MMLRIVASDSNRYPAILVPAGVKVKTEAYTDLLETKVLL
jgi:hypothetical protein